jgi:SPW repeat
MSTVHPSIEQHPDILALRARYDRAAESMTMQGTFGLTFLTALYCALSPWIVGFDATTRLAVNDLIVGIAVAVLTFGFGAALDRTHGMTWTLPVFGVWLVVSPFVMRDVHATAGMIWSNLITGALIFFFGLVAVYYGMRAHTPEEH